MRFVALCAALATALALPQDTAAWEAATTHPGITEQAALQSALHSRLRDDLGIAQGLFAPLVVPPADAPQLFRLLRAFNPTHGYVPDNRGRLAALGWIAAGAAVADSPYRQALNHFYDPELGQGLTSGAVEEAETLSRRLLARRLGQGFAPGSRLAAPDWVVDSTNPMSLAGFVDQYVKAVIAQTPGERSRHIAGALVAAGAIAHVLQDMGSPSHVRNDLAAHYQKLGGGPFDVGSRFERVAAAVFGRLGVPAATAAVEAASLRAFFTTPDKRGLADQIAARFFSESTLPDPVRLTPGLATSVLGERLLAKLSRKHPAPLARGLDLQAARGSEGAVLRNDEGICVANYTVRDDVLRWHMTNECMAEQASYILPMVTAYSTGLINWLFRGSLGIVAGDNNTLVVRVAGAALGKGTVQIFWDDGRGVRMSVSAPAETPGAATGDAIATVAALPKEAQAVAVLFRGVDAAGELLVAAGYYRLNQPAAKTEP